MEDNRIGIMIDKGPSARSIQVDLNRVYKASGRGSYQDVVRNIPLWLSQFPNAGTKVTISSADIPYIKESVLHLYFLGIHEVNINCVFEDVWKSEDDILFEEQLMMLAVDAMGNFYPCTRFAQYSLRNKKAWIIGNIHDGIDKNKLRPFLTLDRCTQSTKECIK